MCIRDRITTADCQNNYQSLDKQLVIGRQPQNIQTIFDHAENENADYRPCDRAFSAGLQCTAKHDAGDDVHLIGLTLSLIHI